MFQRPPHPALVEPDDVTEEPMFRRFMHFLTTPYETRAQVARPHQRQNQRSQEGNAHRYRESAEEGSGNSGNRNQWQKDHNRRQRGSNQRRSEEHTSELQSRVGMS